MSSKLPKAQAGKYFKAAAKNITKGSKVGKTSNIYRSRMDDMMKQIGKSKYSNATYKELPKDIKFKAEDYTTKINPKKLTQLTTKGKINAAVKVAKKAAPIAGAGAAGYVVGSKSKKK